MLTLQVNFKITLKIKNEGKKNKKSKKLNKNKKHPEKKQRNK